MVIEVSVAVIAAAFVLLVIFLIVIIVALCLMLRHVNHALISVNKQVDDIGTDIKVKMASLNPVFHSISNMGEMLEQKTINLKAEQKPQPPELQMADILDFASMGVRLWQNIKKRR
jgi:uncharacterized protein YoxC